MVTLQQSPLLNFLLHMRILFQCLYVLFLCHIAAPGQFHRGNIPFVIRLVLRKFLRQVAEQYDWYQDQRGTYYTDIGKIAQHCYGMEYEQHKGLQMDDLADLKEKGAELIVAVDHAILARPYLSKIAAPDHVVEVIGFDYSDAENPKVIINDPGRSDGQGAVYPFSVFRQASYVTDRQTGVTGLKSVTALYRGGTV